jgi:rhodanese-related sulfurtransferase
MKNSRNIMTESLNRIALFIGYLRENRTAPLMVQALLQRRECLRLAPKASNSLTSACASLSFAMHHSPGFLKMVEEARPNVKELTIPEAQEHLLKNPDAVLLDVREDGEWQKEHAADAVHLGKGILERDLEARFPDPVRELIMYCGGGYRSILTAVSAQKLGYQNVYSLKGGYKALVEAKWRMKSGP